MAEGDFDVVQLADALAVSKSSLYRKDENSDRIVTD